MHALLEHLKTFEILLSLSSTQHLLRTADQVLFKSDYFNQRSYTCCYLMPLRSNMQIAWSCCSKRSDYKLSSLKPRLRACVENLNSPSLPVGLIDSQQTVYGRRSCCSACLCFCPPDHKTNVCSLLTQKCHDCCLMLIKTGIISWTLCRDWIKVIDSSTTKVLQESWCQRWLKGRDCNTPAVIATVSRSHEGLKQEFLTWMFILTTLQYVWFLLGSAALSHINTELV